TKDVAGHLTECLVSRARSAEKHLNADHAFVAHGGDLDGIAVRHGGDDRMYAAQRKIDESRRFARVIEPFPDPQGYRLERPEESMTIRRRQGGDQTVGV